MTMVKVLPFATFEDALLWEARRWLFVREVGGPNRGFWVEWIQRFTGNKPGDSWCASFVSMILSIMCGGKAFSPISVTASCEDIYLQAKREGWLTDTPSIGDVFLYVDANDHAHHTGFVTAVELVTGLAGNTSADGTSSNGDRVAEHALRPSSGRVVYVHFPRPLLAAA